MDVLKFPRVSQPLIGSVYAHTWVVCLTPLLFQCTFPKRPIAQSNQQPERAAAQLGACLIKPGFSHQVRSLALQPGFVEPQDIHSRWASQTTQGSQGTRGAKQAGPSLL